MELIFINVGIIVFFLVWGFILISKSFGADIRDEDEEEAWKKYQNSRRKRMQYEKNTNTRH